MDTIVALSTPWGRSAIALIRISGPKTTQIISELCGKDLQSRTPSLVVLRNRQNRVLDEALVTLFRAPNSYTGEDLAEIGAHGNPLIIEELINEIVSRETVRMAEGGEFTRRALANGRMSLDQVEGLDWIVNSRTKGGVDIGLRAKIEGLSGVSSKIEDKILDILAITQSQLDFSEDEVGQTDRNLLAQKIETLINELKAWVRAFEDNKHLLTNWAACIIGPPNSGKSSLFNALLGRNRSIVFDQPGTTRDFVEADMNYLGSEVALVDTAGIRLTNDPVEGIGIDRSIEVIGRSDVLCWVDEYGNDPDPDLFERFKNKNWVFIQSKADLNRPARPNFIPVSVNTGLNVNEIKQKLLPKTSEDSAHHEMTPLTSNRQKLLVETCVAGLDKALFDLVSGEYLDMVTEEILSASRAIKGLAEVPENEGVLREIFSRFCIGK